MRSGLRSVNSSERYAERASTGGGTLPRYNGDRLEIGNLLMRLPMNLIYRTSRSYQ